jgi:hypothetical protein
LLGSLYNRLIGFPRKKGTSGYWKVILFDGENEIERKPLVGVEVEEDFINDRGLIYADDIGFEHIGTHWQLWCEDFEFVGGKYSHNLKIEGGKQFVRFSLTSMVGGRGGLVITMA